MKLSMAQVRDLAASIVLRHPEGIGGKAIADEILRRHPEMVAEDGRPNGAIRGAVWNLHVHFPHAIASVDGKFVPKACDVSEDEERAVIVVYQEAQARIRHQRIDETRPLRDAARAIVPALRRVAADINKARSDSGAAKHCGHIGIDGVARLRLEMYLKIKDKALDAADYPLDQLISRTGGERLP